MVFGGKLGNLLRRQQPPSCLCYTTLVQEVADCLDRSAVIALVVLVTATARGACSLEFPSQTHRFPSVLGDVFILHLTSSKHGLHCAEGTLVEALDQRYISVDVVRWHDALTLRQRVLRGRHLRRRLRASRGSHESVP